MKHDRHPHRANVEKCAHGYLVSVDHGASMKGTLYAYDTIHGVVAWFLDQYGEADAQGIEAATADETQSGSAEGESPVAKPCARKDIP